jgi:elongation factor G
MRCQVDFFASERIRNVALVGASSSGKTTLAEAILAETGSIGRMGSVEDGSTVSDFDPLEISHRHSIALTMLSTTYQGIKLNLIDTPGISDFVGEVIAVLSACEFAVFVISAADTLGPDTIRLWKLAEELKVPRFVFLNKLDKERANFNESVEHLRQIFGEGITLMDLPLDTAENFHTLANLLEEDAIVYSDGHGAHEPLEAPDRDREHQEHEQLVEAIVVHDDLLMERYLDGQEPPSDALEHLLASSVASAEAFPLIPGSALTRVGVDQLIRFILELGPPPTGTRHDEGSEIATAQVFKTFIDPFLGRLSLMKIRSGALVNDMVLHNLSNGTEERLHGIVTRCGKETIPLTQAAPGDIIAVSKLGHTFTGDTLAGDRHSVSYGNPNFPHPTYQVVCELKDMSDDERVFASLLRAMEEDPTLRVDRDPRTHKIRMLGLGELHLANVIERVGKRHKSSIELVEPGIDFLHTITREASATQTYKKQSGGHGQYAAVSIVIRPLPRGAGFSFVDKIVGGAIPRNFIPAVEKGIVETLASGIDDDYPIVDIEVELVDGKFHSVDSSELAFKTAGSLAFRQAYALADPVVLEPIDHISVETPIAFQGDVLSDLQSRRARILATDIDGTGISVRIDAHVPEAELRRYTVELRALTAGQANYHYARDHYEPVK